MKKTDNNNCLYSKQIKNNTSRSQTLEMKTLENSRSRK